MRLIIISSSDIARTAFQSHVIAFMENIRNRYDIPMALFTFQGTIHSDDGEITEKRAVKLHDITGPENIHLFNKKSPAGLYTQKKAIEQYIASCREDSIFLLCQNYYAGCLGCLIRDSNKDIQVHVDFKGIVPEEHLMYDTGIGRFVPFAAGKVFEHIIFKYADSFSVVSHRFKEYFASKYDLKGRKFLVMPSVYDDEKFYYDEKLRNKYRKKLYCSDNDNLITYCGSLKNWQQPALMFKMFKQLSNFKENKFLVLTFDVEAAKRLSEENAIPEEMISIFPAPPEKVNACLNASDVCVLFRKDDIVNNVASPTKFAEYLVTKNRILISEGVGDFSDMVKNSNYGICLKESDLVAERLMELIRNKREPADAQIEEFRSEYCIDANIKKTGNLMGYL